MSCVTCGRRSDCDLCERCTEDMYAEEYHRQADQDAYDVWVIQQQEQAR